MNNRRSLLKLIPIALVPSHFAGCATQTNPYIIETKALSRTENGGEIKLTRRVQYSPRQDLYYTVTQGVYKAEYENHEGVYFRGPSLCVVGYFQKQNDKPRDIYRQEGGLWIPKDQSSEPFRIYYYPGSGGFSGSLESTQTITSALNGPAFGASPIQAGIGAGIGAGVVAAIINMENKDRINFFPFPESGRKLDEFYVD